MSECNVFEPAVPDFLFYIDKTYTYISWNKAVVAEYRILSSVNGRYVIKLPSASLDLLISSSIAHVELGV